MRLTDKKGEKYMFTMEEFEVLETMEMLTLPKDMVVYMLCDNMNNADSDFVKEFLECLVNKISDMSDYEFEEAIDSTIEILA
jgi:hypothetical protein